MERNPVQALDSYPMDGWRSSRTHPLAKRETLTGPQVRILHHPHNVIILEGTVHVERRRSHV